MALFTAQVKYPSGMELHGAPDDRRNRGMLDATNTENARQLQYLAPAIISATRFGGAADHKTATIKPFVKAILWITDLPTTLATKQTHIDTLISRHITFVFLDDAVPDAVGTFLVCMARDWSGIYQAYDVAGLEWVKSTQTWLYQPALPVNPDLCKPCGGGPQRFWLIAGTGHAGWSGDGGDRKAAALNTPIGLATTETGLMIGCRYSIRKLVGATITTIAGVGIAPIDTLHIHREDGSALGVDLDYVTSITPDIGPGIYFADAISASVGTQIGQVHVSDEDLKTWVAAPRYSGTQLWALPRNYGDTSGISTGTHHIGPLPDYAGEPSTIPVRVFWGGAWGLCYNADQSELYVSSVMQFSRFYSGFDGGTFFVPSESFSNITALSLGTSFDDDLPLLVGATAQQSNLSLSDDSSVSASTTPINSPMGLAFGPDSLLYFSESGSHKVRYVGHDNAVHTYAGSQAGLGSPGYTGDGGLAIDATLNHPAGIAFDPCGNLYIADSGNNVIRRVERTTGRITTIAGLGQYDTVPGHPALGLVATETPGTGFDSMHPPAVDGHPQTWLYTYSIVDAMGVEQIPAPLTHYSDHFVSNVYVLLSGILPGPAGTTKRYIYRSKTNGSFLYRLGELNDNTTTIFDDKNGAGGAKIPDSSLDTTHEPLPAPDGSPANAITLHNPLQLIWADNGIYVSSTDENKVYYIGCSLPDIWT